MQLGPIISSLRRHRTASILIVAEIALTCAIVSNAVFLISERLTSMNRVSGLAESELLVVNVAGIGETTEGDAITRTDLEALRSLPGVKSVAATNQVPFGNSSWNSDVRLTPGSTMGVNAAVYLGSEDLLETFGLQLIAGRDFTPEEYADLGKLQSGADGKSIPSALMTRALAARLFPGKSGLGELIYSWGDEPIRIVGIVRHLIRPGNGKASEIEDCVIFPVRLAYSEGGRYVLRAETGNRAKTLEAAVAALEKNNPNRVVLDKETFKDIRDEFFENDRAMAWLLVAVCLALLLITALGIVGLASFWVQQRRRQIGVRRALGATRGDIMAYFQTENFLLASVGIALGMIMAFGINSKLMQHYEIPRLPVLYLPIGAVLLYILCQIAVLGPALRASRVPPAVATRGI